MDVEHLRQRFPDEQSCRRFFETVLWPDGPVCPHCHGQKAWRIDGESTREGLLECATCRQQFTVTTKTPFHATKLTLWLWVQAMYSLVNSSKGVSSVYVAKLAWSFPKDRLAYASCLEIAYGNAPALNPQAFGNC